MDATIAGGVVKTASAHLRHNVIQSLQQIILLMKNIPIDYVLNQLQSKRFHVKVKTDGKKYNRKKEKRHDEFGTGLPGTTPLYRVNERISG
jgi:hypothetical protein